LYKEDRTQNYDAGYFRTATYSLVAEAGGLSRRSLVVN